jgi:Spy/CpxP family protein refolding chaperone
MKQTRIILIACAAICLCVAFTNFALAQQAPPPGGDMGPGMGMGPGHGGPKGKLMQRLEQMMIWELSDVMKLTQDKETKLFDILRWHFKERRNISEKQFNAIKALKDAYDNPKTPDSKLKKLLDQLRGYQDAQMKLEAQMQKKIASVLSVREQARFMIEWPRVLEDVRKSVQEHRHGGEGDGGGEKDKTKTKK